jgi:hypothetical protein
MLARHSILHELGRGATGAVYAARDRTSGAVVALKRLDPLLLKSDAELGERFLQHARSARQLAHRNIVRIHDAGEAAGTAYVAMEMLEGDNLRRILDAGPLPVARAVRIAHEIAAGLAHAHLEGVMHGGLKPSNVIVLRSGAVKITDFGIGQLGHAALLSAAPPGGLGYLSPEQLRGDPVDHRSDLFSLGVLFYEMLTRRRPFEGDSPKAILENILRAEPPPPSALNPHVPRALDAIVLGMLAGQPAARTPGVPVVLRELQRVEEALGLGSGASARTDAPAASVPPAPPTPRPRMPEPEPRMLEPELRMREPEPNRIGDRMPMHDAPRFAQHDEFRDARGFSARPGPSAADELRERAVFDYHRALMERGPGPERSSGSRPAVFAALALVLTVLGIGLTDYLGLTTYREDWSARIERGIAASRMPEVPPTPPQASRPTAPAPVAEAPREPVTAPAAPPASPAAPAASAAAPPASPPRAVAEAKAEQESPAILPAPEPAPVKPLAPAPESRPLAQAESPFARAPEPPARPVAKAPAQPRLQPAAKVPAPQPGKTARLLLAVSPRGELYIDGAHHGSTPPITMLELEPGMHRIEVRNGSRKPFLTYMTVEPGDVRRIRHDFDAKPIRPPG